MKVACVGGGPSGLFFAILMKLRDPKHRVDVYERHEAGNTFGWGVVFSNQVIETLVEVNQCLAHRILDQSAEWDEVEVRRDGRVMRSSGHGYIGIGRQRLLDILAERAKELGVVIHYGVEVTSLDQFDDVDLIVAADGINSRIRATYAPHFEPDVETRHNRYIWLGTHQTFPAFTFIFAETDHGWFQAHAYQFEEGTSTFIVECTEETYRAHRLHDMSPEDGIAFCERLFADELGEHRLITNARHLRGSHWLKFHRVNNARWHHDNIVLLGDAAHTAHFSIGSGTRLGLDDAISLTQNLHTHEDMAVALCEYERTRRAGVLRVQSAARNSTVWFENVSRYVHFPAEQFFYALLTRSQRLSHQSLGVRDPDWAQAYERWFAQQAGVDGECPPMFTPYTIRGLELSNRIVVSPMSTYQATEGQPDAFHLVHLGARALGGAALIITEMTAVTPQGRITPRCAGIYDESHVNGWRAITDFVHEHTDAKIALQLGHAGPRGSTCPPCDGDNKPLAAGGWETLAPSAYQAWPGCATPKEMTAADMDAVVDAYVAATERAERAGFDMIELHAAHGYLLAAFLSPLLNRRADQFGDSQFGRRRFPLRVFEAVRAAWPADKPISVRISATDWVEGGLTPTDAVRVAAQFVAAGADIIDVSSGQTTPDEKPVYGRMYQTPLSDQIRNEAKVPTMAVGNIYLPDHVNSIIAAGRADLCCLGRPHLADPNWTLRAAMAQGASVQWPAPYVAGGEQLARLWARGEDLALVAQTYLGTEHE